MGYLPRKMVKKLVFVLCGTCADNRNIGGRCAHTKVSGGFLTGVWCTDGLNGAVSGGYRVLKYHEIWHWPGEAWVGGGFFADYIRPLLELEHESGGWPEESMADEEGKAYIAGMWEMDGVKLDPLEIMESRALRGLCRMFLGSVWGKFARNPVKVGTRLVYNSGGLAVANFFDDPNFEPAGLLPCGGHEHFISRRPGRDFLGTSPFTSLAIAAITACAARLGLTGAMERVGIENVVYCGMWVDVARIQLLFLDADSVIFGQKKDGDPLGDLGGDNLGYLTNEVPPGNELVEVVAMAPKVYALRMGDKDGNYSYTVRARGVCLSSGNTGSVNFGTMKEGVGISSGVLWQAYSFRMNAFIRDGVATPVEGEVLTFEGGDNALDGLWTFGLEKTLGPRVDEGHCVDGVVAPFGQVSGDMQLVGDYPF